MQWMCCRTGAGTWEVEVSITGRTPTGHHWWKTFPMLQRTQLPLFQTTALDGTSGHSTSAMMVVMIVINGNTFSYLNPLLFPRGVPSASSCPFKLTGAAGPRCPMPCRMLLLLLMLGHSAQELSCCSEVTASISILYFMFLKDLSE